MLMLTQTDYRRELVLHGTALAHLLEHLPQSFGQYLKRSVPEVLHETRGVVYFVDNKTSVTLPAETTTLVFVKDLSSIELERYTASKFIQIYNSSERRNKAFNLTLSDVKRLLKKKVCHYTGIPVGTSSDKTHPQQITFDRVDATLGYTKANVVICCHQANQFKNTIEHEFTDVLSRSDQLKMLTKMFS